MTPSPPGALWITTDRFGVIVDCATAALALIGYKAGRVRGRSLPPMFVQDRPTFDDL